MRLQVGGVDHHRLRLGSRRRKPFHHPREHARRAPALPPVVKRLVRAVSRWRVLPLQIVPDHVDDAAHHASHYPLVRRQVPIGVSVS